MSIKILKEGILDTVQDSGRFGWFAAGIPPGGAMDRFSAEQANILLSNAPAAPVLEMHFPAAEIRINQEADLVLCGADFSPVLDGRPVPMHHPFRASSRSVLRFNKWIRGQRTYLAISPGFDLEPWLGSFSTNIMAGAGGYQGRRLQTGDILPLQKNERRRTYQNETNFFAMGIDHSNPVVRFIKGSEFYWMDESSIHEFFQNEFTILPLSNRMGCRLAGYPLKVKAPKELVSSPVSFGTIQLLPDGQLVILMADHQTTGGYPRIGNIISADLPLLAQKTPGSAIRFEQVSLEEAELLYLEQRKYLHKLSMAVQLKK